MQLEQDVVVQGCTPEQHLLQTILALFGQMQQPCDAPLCTAAAADALHAIYPSVIKRCGHNLQQQDAAEAWTLLLDSLRTAFQQSGDHQVQFCLSPHARDQSGLVVCITFAVVQKSAKLCNVSTYVSLVSSCLHKVNELGMIAH